MGHIVHLFSLAYTIVMKNVLNLQENITLFVKKGDKIISQ